MIDIRLCPYCGEDDIEWDDIEWMDQNSLTYNTMCHKCGKHWREHYSLDCREPYDNDIFPNASEALLPEER